MDAIKPTKCKQSGPEETSSPQNKMELTKQFTPKEDSSLQKNTKTFKTTGLKQEIIKPTKRRRSASEEVLSPRLKQEIIKPTKRQRSASEEVLSPQNKTKRSAPKEASSPQKKNKTLKTMKLKRKILATCCDDQYTYFILVMCGTIRDSNMYKIIKVTAPTRSKIKEPREAVECEFLIPVKITHVACRPSGGFYVCTDNQMWEVSQDGKVKDLGAPLPDKHVICGLRNLDERLIILATQEQNNGHYDIKVPKLFCGLPGKIFTMHSFISKYMYPEYKRILKLGVTIGWSVEVDKLLKNCCIVLNLNCCNHERTLLYNYSYSSGQLDLSSPPKEQRNVNAELCRLYGQGGLIVLTNEVTHHGYRLLRLCDRSLYFDDDPVPCFDGRGYVQDGPVTIRSINYKKGNWIACCVNCGSSTGYKYWLQKYNDPKNIIPLN